MIADNETASADNIVGSLRAAFEDKKIKGVILRINSPGGSPVQSGYIYDEIASAWQKPNIKVYAVITDLGRPALTTSPALPIRFTPTRRAWWVPSV